MCIGNHANFEGGWDGRERKLLRKFCEPGSPGTHESVTTGAEEWTKYGKMGYNAFKKLK
jgi:hypothetical protein